MATVQALFPSTTARAMAAPRVGRIGLTDLREALAEGVEDFSAMPTHVAFVVLIYPVAGLLIGAATFHTGLIPLLFPLASGFALLGPFAALHLYALSRRRAENRDARRDDLLERRFEAPRLRAPRAILSVGLMLAGIFLAWLVTAVALYRALFGAQMPESGLAFLEAVFTTPHGWALIVVGNLAGAAFSLLALAVSAMSLPMLAERDVDAVTAVRTSIAVLRENPVTMLAWGLTVAGLLVLGMLSFFVGLAVVLPILGHATWHLYRRAVP